MVPRSSAGKCAAFWKTLTLQQAFASLGVFKKIRKNKTDSTSVQAGRASSSYASEVCSSAAVERANEGTKTGSDCVDLENMK